MLYSKIACTPGQFLECGFCCGTRQRRGPVGRVCSFGDFGVCLAALLGASAWQIVEYSIFLYSTNSHRMLGASKSACLLFRFQPTSVRREGGRSCHICRQRHGPTGRSSVLLVLCDSPRSASCSSEIFMPDQVSMQINDWQVPCIFFACA